MSDEAHPVALRMPEAGEADPFYIRSTAALADDLDGMVRGVEAVDQFSPEECRRRALDFTAERMAWRYARIYHEVIASHRSGESVGTQPRFVDADG